jgi:hypothetical protein
MRSLPNPGFHAELPDPKLANCYSTQTAGLDPYYRSGPAGYFFFLLAVGTRSLLGTVPSCDGRPITGIGNAKAEKVWYRALTEYMDENTDYRAARVATLKAAADLYGDHGVEYNTVNSAWAAVSVRGVDPFPGGSAPRLINPGDQRMYPGATVNLQIEASDPRGLPLTYAMTNLPPGLSVNTTTGLITGSPTTKGSYRVTVAVTNSIAEANATWFMWTVL